MTGVFGVDGEEVLGDDDGSSVSTSGTCPIGAGVTGPGDTLGLLMGEPLVAPEGLTVGDCVEYTMGDLVGVTEVMGVGGSVCAQVGFPVGGSLGSLVGSSVGSLLGTFVVGARVGIPEGKSVG